MSERQFVDRTAMRRNPVIQAQILRAMFSTPPQLFVAVDDAYFEEIEREFGQS